jgi:hypothetical protein
MKQFRDRAAHHPLHAEFDRYWGISKKVDQASLAPEARDGLARSHRVIRFARSVVTRTDPALVSPTMMAELHTAIQALTAQFDSYATSPDVANLNTHADSLLDHLFRWPNAASSELVPLLSKEIDELRASAQQQLDVARGHAEAKDKELKALKDELEAIRGTLSVHGQTIEQQKARFDTLITDEQSRFLTSQSDRDVKFNDFAEQMKRAHQSGIDAIAARDKQQVAEFEQVTTAKVEEVDAKAANLLTLLNQHEVRAKDIVGIIGNVGVTGNYLKVANREWWGAEIFRGLAILFFIAAAGVICWVVSHVIATDFSWQIALFRLSIAAVLVLPAFYCAKESNAHRYRESRNRRIELELASIAPFLEKIDPEKAKGVIERKADEYFGVQAADESDSRMVKVGRSKVPLKDLVAIVQQLGEVVKSLK